MLRSRRMLFPKSRSLEAPTRIPQSTADLLSRADAFRNILAEAKKEPPSEFGWYPYHTMVSLHHLAPILRKHFGAFERGLLSGPLLDAGCGDGELAYFFASLGID